MLLPQPYRCVIVGADPHFQPRSTASQPTPRSTRLPPGCSRSCRRWRSLEGRACSAHRATGAAALSTISSGVSIVGDINSLASKTPRSSTSTCQQLGAIIGRTRAQHQHGMHEAGSPRGAYDVKICWSLSTAATVLRDKCHADIISMATDSSIRRRSIIKRSLTPSAHAW